MLPELLAFALLLSGVASAAEEIVEAPPPLVVGQDVYANDDQLTRLVSILLDENPEILAARASWESQRSRAPQAAALPDPRLRYRYFARTPETRVGPQQHALELSQGLPWGGKRKLQSRREEHLASSAAWSVRDLERDRVAELKQAYYEAAYLQEALAVNDEERALLQRFEQIALTRYSTGKGIQQDAIKIQTAVSRLTDRETLLHERMDLARSRIAGLIGRAGAEIELDLIELGVPTLSYDRDALVAESNKSHPRVRAALERIEADRAWARRRSLDSRPDFTVGVGYTWVGRREDPAGIAVPPPDNGKDILAFTFGIDLPLFGKRIRSGVAEAEKSALAGEHTLRGARDGLRTEVRDALLRLESLEARSRLHAEVIILQAEESLASAEAAYVTNEQGFLDVLDAQRVLFQARLTYQRLVADYWCAAADLEHALGSIFPEFAENDPVAVTRAGLDPGDSRGANR
jgi:outer membrane protein TolC